MGPLEGLEKSIAGVFKGAPALPKGAKEWLVKYLPWLTVLGAIGSAWAAYAVWHWAHLVGQWADYLNTVSALYGGTTVATTRMTVWIWIGFIVLLAEAVIYLAAYPGLKAVKKAGWNFLFLGSIVNLVYGVVMVFSDYNGAGNLVGAVIGAIIGWYLLFQIRDHYLGKKTEAAAPKAE